MAPKEFKKGWEKERRDRLNGAFDNLGKLLPCFDPSIKLSKIEILEKATIYIEELNSKINKPLNAVNEDTNKLETGTEIKKLFERVTKLLSRNELLSNLLKNAGIKAPKEYGFNKISPTKKWSQKISPNLANVLAQKEAQKENKPLKRKKAPNKSRTIQKLPIPKGKRVNVKARRRKNSLTNKTTVRMINQNLLPIANVQPCYLISNGNSNRVKNGKSKTNVINPPSLVCSNINPTPQILSANIPVINTLPSTTLLLTNNNISTILPQPLFQTPPFIVKPNIPTYILVSTTQSNQENINSVVSDSSKVDAITKSLVPLRSKKRVVTTTTQINKVPIPALTSSYGSGYLDLSSNTVDSKVRHEREVKKKAKRPLKYQNGNDLVESVTKKSKTSLEKGNLEKTSSNEVEKQITNDKVITERKEHENLVVPQSNNTQSNDTVTNGQISVSSAQGPVVNTNPIVLVPSSETTQTNISGIEASRKDVDISKKPAKPDVTFSLKNTSSTIITDKELLNSINNTTDKDIETIVNQTELSNDLFATLQVPAGSQNPESTSPTAAFLNAFPLVSSKIQEVLEDETSDSRRDTPTLLQIGTIDVTKTTQTPSENLTPSLMNLDNFAFFSAKDIYQPFDNIATTVNASTGTFSSVKTTEKVHSAKASKDAKIIYERSVPTYGNSSGKAPVATTHHIQNVDNAAVKQNLVNSSTLIKLDNVSSQSKLHNVNQVKPLVNVVKKNLFPTTTTNSFPIISSSSLNQMYYTSVTSTMQSTVSSLSYQSNKVKISPEKYPKCTSTQANVHKTNQMNECNTLNPFTDIPKADANCSYNVATTKSYSDLYNNVNSNCHYNYQTDFSTNFNSASNKQYYNKESNQASRYYGYDNYNTLKCDKFEPNNFGSSANYYPDKSKFADQQKSATNKTADIVHKAPVNWMTTPDLKQAQVNNDFPLFPANKETHHHQQVPSYSQNSFNNNPSQNSYFNASAPIYPTIPSDYNMISDHKKHFDLPFQRNDGPEDHQINWSPTKHVNLDGSHNFGILPTLEGDLALGTQGPYLEPKLTPKKDLSYKSKESRKNLANNFEATNSFLSVSQFIEPCTKPSDIPAKVSNRRISGGRVKSRNNQVNSRSNRSNNGIKASEAVHKDNTPGYNSSKSINKVQSNQYSKPVHNQNQVQNSFIPDNNMWLSSSTNNTKSVSSGNAQTSSGKNVYTAESLISHNYHHQNEFASHATTKSSKTNQQYTSNYHRSLPTPSFLPDNIMPYFPTMDMPPSQENTNQHNQGYVGTNSFPAASFPVSIQNNYNNNYTPLSTPSIGGNYLQPPNYMAELPNHDYGLLTDNIFSHTSKSSNEHKHSSKSTKASSTSNIKSDQQESLVVKKNQFNYSTIPANNHQKKSKRKQTVESTQNMSNIDFGFLSTIPANNNSPILPDDFHTNFLPPPPNPHQLYPCKAPLYGTKQASELPSGNLLALPSVARSNIQHPEISPSNNIGTTLTNFNLSTILKY